MPVDEAGVPFTATRVQPPSPVEEVAGHEGGTSQGSQHRPSGFGVRVTACLDEAGVPFTATRVQPL